MKLQYMTVTHHEKEFEMTATTTPVDLTKGHTNKGLAAAAAKRLNAKAGYEKYIINSTTENGAAVFYLYELQTKNRPTTKKTGVPKTFPKLTALITKVRAAYATKPTFTVREGTKLSVIEAEGKKVASVKASLATSLVTALEAAYA